MTKRRKPVAPVPNQEGVSNGAPGAAVSGPSTGRPSGHISPSDLVKPADGAQRVFLSIDVVCPSCGVPRGERCQRWQDGKMVKLDISHNSRAKRAEQATKHWAAWHGDKARNAELPPI